MASTLHRLPAGLPGRSTHVKLDRQRGLGRQQSRQGKQEGQRPWWGSSQHAQRVVKCLVADEVRVTISCRVMEVKVKCLPFL